MSPSWLFVIIIKFTRDTFDAYHDWDKLKNFSSIFYYLFEFFPTSISRNGDFIFLYSSSQLLFFYSLSQLHLFLYFSSIFFSPFKYTNCPYFIFINLQIKTLTVSSFYFFFTVYVSPSVLNVQCQCVAYVHWELIWIWRGLIELNSVKKG